MDVQVASTLMGLTNTLLRIERTLESLDANIAKLVDQSLLAHQVLTGGESRGSCRTARAPRCPA
jgi:hypothetical protein